ncbi:MAG: pirin family protein, partial [Bacteroidetes bacterium]|nr:pirin family protein [Bacteroidota bacterium]
QFGALRVLNDDRVAPGMGFGQHPHRNMEIISIPLEGSLKHRDSIGNVHTITAGEVQLMSAGTGIEHAEINGSPHQPVHFLQIWILPEKEGVTPRYQQFDLNKLIKDNQLTTFISPDAESSGGWLHQQAWFSMGRYTKETTESFRLNRTANGVYFFLISGEARIHDQELLPGDGFGVSDLPEGGIEVFLQANTQLLAIEVPLNK